MLDKMNENETIDYNEVVLNIVSSLLSLGSLEIAKGIILVSISNPV
jgi:hypothetical protein